MTLAVPFAGHLGLEIIEVSVGEATVVLPDRPSSKPRRLPTRRRPLHRGRDRLGRGLRRRLRRADGRRDAARRSAEISYEKIANGAITVKARLAVPAAQALETLDAEGKVEFPCEIELTDANGTLVAAANVRWHVRLKSGS